MRALLVIILVGLQSSVFSQSTASSSSSSSGSTIEHLTATTFKQKIFDYSKSKTWSYKGKLPAIIDFYADWCRPCKMIAPHLEAINKDYKGKLHVYKVNTDKEQELAQVFGIQSIPAVLFIPVIFLPQMLIGAHPKEEYEKQIKTLFNISK
jgi:thioredoxin